MKRQMGPAKSSIDPRDLEKALRERPGGLLLDVRSPVEFNEAHIRGAQLVPLGDLIPEKFMKEAGPGCQPLFVICQSGARARKAIEAFESAGFDRCCFVEGGMEAWTRAGMPVERGQSGGILVLRQAQLIIGTVTAVAAALALAVDVRFAIIPLISGTGLIVAGATGHCGLALILAKMSWNRSQKCRTGFCCEPVEKGTV
jgi:rhodanese-related sulfurtransferase